MAAVRTFLDHNASSPLRPEARNAMIAAFDNAGNPSSVHAEGRAARAIIEAARETIASVFNVKPSQVYFTSGGTEAANWLLRPRKPGQKLFVSPIEHACVLRGHSFGPEEVRSIAVCSDGIIDLSALERKREELAGSMIAVQAANSETGVIQPIAEIAAIGQAEGATFICDAVQAIGKVEHQVLAGSTAMFFSAHKFGGPKGVGAAVLMDERLAPTPLLRGGGQERRQRSGTENVPGIAGMAAALKAAYDEREAFAARTAALQSKLEAGILAIAPDACIFARRANRLPNTTFFAVSGIRAELLLMALDLDGVAISSGSACSSGKVERSHVLEAMGVSHHLIDGAIRVSTGWNSDDADIDHFLTALLKICGNRRGLRAA